MDRASRPNTRRHAFIHVPSTHIPGICLHRRYHPRLSVTIVHGHRLANLHISFPISGEVLTYIHCPV
ncbi:hypothetical protein COCVIDRAFT_89299 [Bipolaris victoriae FI3]|uniref:Uncharacterized protein n=1 Tax=Bipolaris victoriae (strain FI3) TaxID=930091 RepID=W7EYE3_BIPV3|nr:hypothetical protein COCVIDRAFT_89299 [Bipolaris victoriae FI3]